MGETHVVGISDCKVGSGADESVITYALGSCVGLALYDARAKVGGILHIMLPDSSVRSSNAELNPFMYADSGVQAFLQLLASRGADRARLVAKAAGGANMLRHSSVLDIGMRNIEAVMAIIERERIPLLGRSLGGTVGRSMQISLDDGTVHIRLLGVGEEKL
jgi:chemotaxis protein CheD